MPKKIVIKRYGNRRLYNSETRSYVKLLDIAEFIREGSEIQVLDSRTGEDITKLVLTQIILEEEKSKKDLLPLNFLYDLIRHQQGWVQEFFQRHVVKALEGYLPPRSGELLTNLRQSLDFRRTPSGLIERLLSRNDPAAVRAAAAAAAAEAAPTEAAALAELPVEARSLELDELADLRDDPAATADPFAPLTEASLEELRLRLEKMESRMGRIEDTLLKEQD